MRKTRLAIPLIAAFALLDAALLVGVVWVVADAPHLHVTLEEAPATGDERAADGEAACHWQRVDDAGAGPVCVHSLAGVVLGRQTLIGDPGYATTIEARGRWFEDRERLYRALVDSPTAPVALVDDAGAPRVVDVSVERSLRPLAARAPATLIGLAIALFVIGAYVYARRPTLAAARALFVFCAAVATTFLAVVTTVLSGTFVHAHAAHTLYVINLASMVLVLTALFQLAIRFPRPQFKPHTERWIWRPLIALAVTALLLEVGGVVPQISTMVSMLGCVVCVVLLVRAMRRVQGQVPRLQVRWVLWGVAVPIVTALVVRLPTLLVPGMTANPSDTLIHLSALTVPVGLAVAVLRYRLLEIEVVVRRTIVGALATLAVLFLYNLVVSAFASGLPADGAATPRPDAVLVVAFVLTFVFVPVQTRLDALLDRFVYRERRQYRDVLGQLPDALATVHSTDDAAVLVLERVGASMNASPLLVALTPPGRNPEESSAINVASQLSETRLWRRVDDGLQRDGDARADADPLEPPDDEAFWAAVDALDEARLGSAEVAEDPLDAWMDRCQLAFVVPLRTPDALVGLLAGALQPAGRLVSAEDVGLLRTVGAALAIALSRSQAYELIRQMNAELEDRVRDRTAELEGARLQLYQWEKMASLGVLAAGVAHELNTPLGVVASTAEQLRDRLQDPGLPDPRANRLSALCAAASRRAADIVDNLRRFSRPESQDLQQVDLNTILDTTVDLLRPALARKGVTVVEHRGELPSIDGFPVLLNQILTNLINNAAAVLVDGGEVRVTTEARGDDRVALIVEDDGHGIPDDVRPRIFEPFFTTKAPGEGTGLGLSLCYSFVEQHGGRIWEEGTAGEGARFVIELPVRHADEAGASFSSLPSYTFEG